MTKLCLGMRKLSGDGAGREKKAKMWSEICVWMEYRIKGLRIIEKKLAVK
jgi:hypothetical protein